MTESTKRAASKYKMNQYHDVVNKHALEEKLNALPANSSTHSLGSMSMETTTSHKVHHIDLSMKLPKTFSKEDEIAEDLHENMDDDTLDGNQSSLDFAYVTSSFQKENLLQTNIGDKQDDRSNNDAVFPMSSMSKTSLESTSTIIQPLPIELMSSSGLDENERFAKQIGQTEGVLERAYRAIRKRDLNALESRTAVDLKINGQDLKKRNKRKDPSLFEEKFRGSPLRHVKREYWPMQSDYSGKSTSTNASHGESLSQTLSLSSLSRHSKSSILNPSIVSNLERPRTRAQKVGQRLPYGVVDRPYTTAGVSGMRSRKKGSKTASGNFGKSQVRKSENDRLYIQQQKLIKKFGVDLWGDPRKKPAAFGMDTYDGRKILKKRIKVRRKKREHIYGKKTLGRSKRKVATSSIISENTNISSHGSLADYSAFSSTPSLKNDNASGLAIRQAHKRMSPGIRNTRSRGSLLSPISSFDVTNHRRPKTSGSVLLQGQDPGPESVFNLDMAGVHIPKDPPRKMTKFEKRIRQQKRMQERTNHMIELQTLSNRVKQLEIVLMEERMARRRKPPARKKKKIKKKKASSRKKKDFVKLAPFKRSATSAVTAMASALAAAASAERFDMAARRLEDSMGEYGMDDELATESARAVKRAATMAGKAINSATTAIHIAAKLQNDPDVGHMFET